MKSKGLETYLYSTVGVAAMLAILIAFNIIAARAKQRIDLTSERAYTLSQGTRNILAKLDTARADPLLLLAERQPAARRLQDLCGTGGGYARRISPALQRANRNPEA